MGVNFGCGNRDSDGSMLGCHSRGSEVSMFASMPEQVNFGSDKLPRTILVEVNFGSETPDSDDSTFGCHSSPSEVSTIASMFGEK